MTNKELSLTNGVKATKWSSFVIALIGLAKGVIGVLSGSVALIAQSVETLNHVITSLTIYVGLKIAQKEPTEKFPYGYYRAETLASLMVAVFIVISGVEILRESILRFLNPEVVSFPYIALSVVAISIPLLYVLGRYNRRIGEEINSQAIMGQAKDFTLDVYASILVFVGVLSSYLGVLWIEPILGAIISVFMIKTGAELGRDAILTLMDAVLTPEHINKIRRTAEKVSGVLGVYNVRLRKSGPFYFGEMHVEVEEGLLIEKAHVIVEEVERRIKQEYKELETLMIHVEPVKKEEFRIAIPIEEDRGLESKPIPHFGSVSHFIFININREGTKNWTVKPNPGAKLSKKLGITAANFLINEKANTLVAGELGEGPFHVLRDGFVEIYKLPKDSRSKEVIEAFLEDKLEKMVMPEKKQE